MTKTNIEKFFYANKAQSSIAWSRRLEALFIKYILQKFIMKKAV